MIKARLDIAEADFSRQMTTLGELSVLIGVDNLTFAITNGQQQLMFLREYAFLESEHSLRDIFAQDDLLHLSYQQTRVAVMSPTFTLVPERLFNPSERRTYLQEIATLNYEVEVRADALTSASAQLVYAAKHQLVDDIGKELPNAKITHATTALIAGLLARQNVPTSPVLYLQIYPGWLVAVLIEGKNLLFANIFNYQSAKDFLYYVLLLFDQYQLAPEETPVYITGQLIENSEIYPLLQRYLRSLRFLPAPDFLRLGTKLKQQPAYFYFNLFSIIKT